MITTAFTFDRKKRATKDIPGTIELRITINRKNQYISTGVRVYKNQWKYGEIINRPDAPELMARIIAIGKKVEAEVARCVENGSVIDLKHIRDFVSCGGNIDSSLHTWIAQRIDTMNVSKGTKSHYSNMFEKMQAFGGFKTWKDFSVENIVRWDSWLRMMKKPHTDEPIGDVGVYNYHKCLKALLHCAYDEGRIDQNPYSRLQGKFKRGDKANVEYLTEDEIERIMNLDIDMRIYAEARDLFVFQMFTGLPFSDMSAFDANDYKYIDGKWVSRQERIKTGVPYVNQLLPPAVAVLERYGWKLPKINNAEYNLRLKEIGRMAGITTRLHTHLARHTFATFMLSNGVRIEHVSKMLGHTNVKQTQRYAKVLAKDVRESFDMIENKLNKKKQG